LNVEGDRASMVVDSIYGPTHYLTPPAVTRVSQARGRQLANRDAPTVVLPPLSLESAPDPVHIATIELLRGRIPYEIHEPQSDGRIRAIPISDPRLQPFAQPVLVPSMLRQ
jgi:DNA-directed RNA polymerase subunit K/omega